MSLCALESVLKGVCACVCCVHVSLYLLSPSGSACLSLESSSVIVWRFSMICAVGRALRVEKFSYRYLAVLYY